MGSQVALVKGNRQMGFQIDRATCSLVLVKGGCQMGSQVALVKGHCQMGFQVDQATPIFLFWIKEVARWDLKWLSLKGIARWDFRLTKLHIFFGFGSRRSPNEISG